MRRTTTPAAVNKATPSTRHTQPTGDVNKNCNGFAPKLDPIAHTAAGKTAIVAIENFGAATFDCTSRAIS